MKKFTLLALGLLVAVFSASAKTTDLSSLSGAYTVQNNEVFYGTGNAVQLNVGNGYHIQFQGNCSLKGTQVGPAINCTGSATIELKSGANVTVTNGNPNYSAIFVKSGSTLEIKGLGNSYQDASLTAQCTATGTTNAAAIGATSANACGNFQITNCTVTAVSKGYGAGIGGGYNSGCGYIYINGDAKVTATCGANANGAISKGYGTGTVGKITIAGVERNASDFANITYTYEPWDGDLYNIPADGVAVALNGTVISGDCNGTQAIYIADGATVTLSQVDINSVHSSTFKYPENAITCLGNATIKLEGRNDIYGAYVWAGIFVPQGSTLTIESAVANPDQSNGSLHIWGGSNGGAAIGAGSDKPAGNIVIKSGYIEAEGGSAAAAIGAGGFTGASCQNITISANVTYLKATKGYNAAYSIGQAIASCGTVTIAGQVTGSISENPFIYPIPAWDGNLSTLNKDVVAQNGTVITGTLSSNHKVAIADGATVVLRDARIEGDGETTVSSAYGALQCEGNATIIIQGNNYLKSFLKYTPAIYVPSGKTLTIATSGDNYGTLDAYCTGGAAGIGAGALAGKAGNIVINGGTINAYGEHGAGIGACSMTDCGNITINGGTILAIGNHAPGIGSGYGGASGEVRISHNVTKVTAIRGTDATQCIGEGKTETVGEVTYSGACAGVYFQQSGSYKQVYNVTGVAVDSIFVYKPSVVDGSYTKLFNKITFVEQFIAANSEYADLLTYLQDELELAEGRLDRFFHDSERLEATFSDLDRILQSTEAEIEEEKKKQGIEDVLDGNAVRTKVIRDGQLFILVGDKTYDAQGKEIK